MIGGLCSIWLPRQLSGVVMESSPRCAVLICLYALVSGPHSDGASGHILLFWERCPTVILYAYISSLPPSILCICYGLFFLQIFAYFIRLALVSAVSQADVAWLSHVLPVLFCILRFRMHFYSCYFADSTDLYHPTSPCRSLYCL